MPPMSPTAPFSGSRAYHHLSRLAELAASPPTADTATNDPLGLFSFLARHTVAPFATPFRFPSQTLAAGVVEVGLNIGGRLRGRAPAPPLVLGAGYRPTGTPLPGETRAAHWGANADGSGAAVLLTLTEALQATPPLQDVQIVLFGHPRFRHGAEIEHTGADAYARSLAALPPEDRPEAVIVLGHVGKPGMTLDLDARSFTHPHSAALLGELFLLGRALERTPFTGGTETIFPGDHVPFLDQELPTVCLSDDKDLLAGTEHDVLDHCDPGALEAAGDVLLRFLRGERVV